MLKFKTIANIYDYHGVEINFTKAYSVFGWHRDRKYKYRITGGLNFNHL